MSEAELTETPKLSDGFSPAKVKRSVPVWPEYRYARPVKEDQPVALARRSPYPSRFASRAGLREEPRYSPWIWLLKVNRGLWEGRRAGKRRVVLRTRVERVCTGTGNGTAEG